MEVQLRYHNGRIETVSSVREAFMLAEQDMEAGEGRPGIWKISWFEDGKSVRFVRYGEGWRFEPMELAIEEAKRIFQEEQEHAQKSQAGRTEGSPEGRKERPDGDPHLG
jgi:hypothetical protein